MAMSLDDFKKRQKGRVKAKPDPTFKKDRVLRPFELDESLKNENTEPALDFKTGIELSRVKVTTENVLESPTNGPLEQNNTRPSNALIADLSGKTVSPPLHIENKENDLSLDESQSANTMRTQSANTNLNIISTSKEVFEDIHNETNSADLQKSEHKERTQNSSECEHKLRTQSANTNSDIISSLDDLHKTENKRANTKTKKTEHKVRIQFDQSLDIMEIPKSVIDITEDSGSLIKERTQYEHKVRTQNENSKVRTQNANTNTQERTQSTNTMRTQERTQNFAVERENVGSEVQTQIKIKGNKLKIFSTVFEAIVNGRQKTITMTHEKLATLAGIKLGSVKTESKRLRDEGLIIKKTLTLGNGSLIEWGIPERYFQLHIANKINQISKLNDVFQGQSANTSANTNATSKLVSNINTNLLGSNDSNFSRSGSNTSLPDFLNADISSLSNFGVYKKQLMDLHNQKQSFELNQMEDFIWKFKEYVSDSEKVRGVRSIPALFITLARQLASGYDPLESIQTPEQKLLEGLIERNKKALMELKRQKEESKSLEFELWFEKLNRHERDELAPPNSIIESGSELQKKSLMGYFDKVIWNG